jgi:dipeptidyl-peptidase-4
VSLAVVSPGGTRVDVDWRSDAELDGAVLEYLAAVEWSGPRPVLALLTRDQRRLQDREVDPATGRTTPLRTVTDEAWVELLPGTPRRLDDGRLLHSIDQDDTRRVWIDDDPVTPPDVLVRSVEAVDGDAVIAQIVPLIGSVALARIPFGGAAELLSDPAGVAEGTAAGGTTVVAQQWPDRLDMEVTVRRGDTPAGRLADRAEPSPLVPAPQTLQVGPRGLPVTVLFPSDHVPGARPLPVLLDPYGGPHGQRVINSARAYLTSQWFAEQGFAVLVVDGRGMSGRGPAWDRLAKNDRAGSADDQVEALHEIARRFPDDLDLSRVAIRGWSFGG